jgi:opacity protein-like surface antigen
MESVSGRTTGSIGVMGRESGERFGAIGTLRSVEYDDGDVSITAMGGMLGWGYPLIRRRGPARIGLGLSVKGSRDRWRFSYSGPGYSVDESFDLTRYDMDAGLLLALRYPLAAVGGGFPPLVGIRVGGVAKDLFGSKTKIHSNGDNSDDEKIDFHDERWRIGGAVELAVGGASPSRARAHLFRFIMSADYMEYFEREYRTPWTYLGAEATIGGWLSLRAGRASQEKTGARFSTWGAGLRFRGDSPNSARSTGLRLDYSVSHESRTAGETPQEDVDRHLMSMVYDF